MWQKETKPECCKVYEELPTDVDCFQKQLNHELNYIRSLHERRFVKSQRLMALANPTKRVPLFIPTCPCRLQKPIEVIYLDQRANTRTEQLAYPKARILLNFRDQVKKLFPPERMMNLNRTIRRSLLSLYSRLGNVQPPKEIVPIKKWDRFEWNKHTTKLKKLATPRPVILQPKIRSKRMPLQRMRRFRFLSKPIKRDVLEKPDWTLTYEMRFHKISERMNNMAQPVKRDTSMLYQDLPIKIPETVLRHKATKRTKMLAQPPAGRTAQMASAELRENPFAISPNALKAKASQRTEDLAEPKEYENKHIRENPYAISPAALKAKAKPRTIALAKPKK